MTARLLISRSLTNNLSKWDAVRIAKSLAIEGKTSPLIKGPNYPNKQWDLGYGRL